MLGKQFLYLSTFTDRQARMQIRFEAWRLRPKLGLHPKEVGQRIFPF